MTEVTVFTTSMEILENFICVKIRDIKIIKKTKEMQKTVTTVTKTVRSLDVYSFSAMTVHCDYCHRTGTTITVSPRAVRILGDKHMENGQWGKRTNSHKFQRE